jgi:hypothetical protein
MSNRHLFISVVALLLVACPKPKTNTDAGTGAPDSGSSVDAGPTDAGAKDAGPIDAGPVDAGPIDAGVVDAGESDAGLDAGIDAGSVDAGPPCGWTQWGHDATHQGHACAVAQPLNRALATVIFDPFTSAEEAEDPGEGDLSAHYQAPLVMGDDVYMEQKSGRFISCNPPGSGQLTDGGICGFDAWTSQNWNETHFQWEPDGGLAELWSYPTDWKPEPYSLAGFEPVFQPALSGDRLYVPGVSGRVHQLDRHSGVETVRLDPFRFPDGGASAIDPNRYVAGPLTVDDNGNLFYTVLEYDPQNPAGPTGTLVKFDPSGNATIAGFNSLVLGAPLPTDFCDGQYNTAVNPQPWPPIDDGGQVIYPQQVLCMGQRPALNAAPAVAPDGTVYVISRAAGDSRYTYVVAVNPDLTPRWATSLRGVLNDGCGVIVPSDVDSQGLFPDGGYHPTHCTIGSPQGIDPGTGRQPAGRAIDESSSSPVVLPSGEVLYGAFTNYNNERGHAFKLDSNGNVVGTYDFGWDVTPASYAHDGTYSVVTKDNHYATYNQDYEGPYYITELDETLAPVWQVLSTNVDDCVRLLDGGVACTNETCESLDDGGQDCFPSHPDGFEWCVNAPAIDATGAVFANSEDGRVYRIDADGSSSSYIFLNESLGAAYTPLAIDGQGRIYSLNGGVMTVVGQ